MTMAMAVASDCRVVAISHIKADSINDLKCAPSTFCSGKAIFAVHHGKRSTCIELSRKTCHRPWTLNVEVHLWLEKQQGCIFLCLRHEMVFFVRLVNGFLQSCHVSHSKVPIYLCKCWIERGIAFSQTLLGENSLSNQAHNLHKKGLN